MCSFQRLSCPSPPQRHPTDEERSQERAPFSSSPATPPSYQQGSSKADKISRGVLCLSLLEKGRRFSWTEMGKWKRTRMYERGEVGGFNLGSHADWDRERLARVGGLQGASCSKALRLAASTPEQTRRSVKIESARDASWFAQNTARSQPDHTDISTPSAYSASDRRSLNTQICSIHTLSPPYLTNPCHTIGQGFNLDKPT